MNNQNKIMNTYSTLNENTCGVQALSHSEMQEIDGGLISIMLIKRKAINRFIDGLKTIAICAATEMAT